MPKRFSSPDVFNGTLKISHLRLPRGKTAHRIKAKDLPPGARFVTRDELRMREVMES